jgi:pimeloyl-ACP methyl ester carboxylesterase
MHVRRNLALKTPPEYLRNLDFDREFTWRDAEMTASDGAVMRGWFLAPQQPTGRCAAVLHGIGDSRLGSLGFASMFLRHGYAVLTPDSRGHNQSGGEVVTYGVREAGDVLGWVDWMRGQGCQEVVGLGESLGAAILLEAAGARPGFRAVVAECAYASFPAIGEERLARATGLPAAVADVLVWPVLFSGISWARLRYGVNLWRVDPAAAAGHSDVPILLIHGLADHRTSPDNSRVIAAAAPRARIWLVPGAGHVAASATDPIGFESRVFAFLASLPTPQK